MGVENLRCGRIISYKRRNVEYEFLTQLSRKCSNWTDQTARHCNDRVPDNTRDTQGKKVDLSNLFLF